MGCKGSKQGGAADPTEIKVQPEETAPAPAGTAALKVGDKVRVSAEGGYDAEVLKFTTTDVLVQTDGKKEKWVDVEDIQQSYSTPPLLNEVKVGAEVTTALGTSGTVMKRTTTEVCIRSAGGNETWIGIEDITVLEVSIICALGLHNKDWIGKSDPYCICQIEGKPQTRVQTKTMTDRLDPVWEFEVGMVSFARGDVLKFEVFDQDTLKKDDFLGQVVLKSEDFLTSGFFGDLELLDMEGAPGMGTLQVKVVPKQVAPELEPERPVEEPTAAEVSEKPRATGKWCC